MQDDAIVELYWQRDQTAIMQTERKYGSYLRKIACNILGDPEDGCECLNDTYLHAWNAIPPHRPARLAPFLGKIARQRAIDMLRSRSRVKRGGGEYALSLSELGDCVSSGDQTLQEAELRRLAEVIGRYLRTLPPVPRSAFVSRYYYCDSIRDIARWSGLREAGVKSLLHRVRQGLREQLRKEGFEL